MKRPSSRFYLALGLASLLTSVLMLAIFLDLVPDNEAPLRANRAALAETLAVTSSALLAQDDRPGLKGMLEFVRQRNKDIESIGLRDLKGELVLSLGNHA